MAHAQTTGEWANRGGGGVEVGIPGWERNKAVYTATPVAGGWVGAVMSWAGALTSMKYSYLNFSSFKLLNNAKKVKCGGPTDGRTEQPTR